MKGALLFTIWDDTPARPTADIDLLGPEIGAPATVRTYFQAVCTTSVEPDGLRFQPNAVTTERIREDQAHDGVRARMVAKLGNATIPVKIDVGFGDVITPGPVTATLPPLLDFPPVAMHTYPPETAVAEKCHAIVDRGATNTRMKDYYDLYVLSEARDFTGVVLAAAIGATFEHRATELPMEPPVGLTTIYGSDPTKQTQWAAFLKQRGLRAVPTDLKAAVSRVAAFLQPAIDAARAGTEWHSRWAAARGWIANTTDVE